MAGSKCTLLAISVLSLDNCFDFSNLQGTICTPNLCNKNIGHRANSRAEDHHASLPGPLIEKKYHVLGKRARLSA